MGGGLVIIDPTTVLRDWVRVLLDLPEVWAGGWPQNSTAESGIVLEMISSTTSNAITTWSTQWDCHVSKGEGGQPGASALAAHLATHLVRTPPRTTIGTSGGGEVLFGGAVEESVSIFPVDDDTPDSYRATLLVDILTIAVPPPPFPPD